MLIYRLHVVTWNAELDPVLLLVLSGLVADCDWMLRMEAADQPAELVTALLGLSGLSRGCVIISALVIRSSNTF